MTMWLKVLCFNLCFLNFLNGEVSVRQCDVSKQEDCVILKECESALNLFNARKYNDLQQLICDFDGPTPLVCCQKTTKKNSGRNIDEVPSEVPALPTPPEVFEERTKETTVPVQQRNELLSPPKCGFSNITNYRVIGGVPAKPHEFPWMVALGYKSKRLNVTEWRCGGTLITDRHVLTAGHCVYNISTLYLARVGELNLFDDNDGVEPEDIKLVKIKLHEKFSRNKLTDDIAILTLERPPTNPWVWPICLPHEEPYRSNNFVKYSPIIAGWGSTYANGPSSPILQYADLPVVSNEECKRAFKNKTLIDDRHICAGWATAEKDSCKGDSGGPLMYGKVEGANLRFYQIGIVSYGYSCAVPGYPGVYTRVTQFIDWIQRNID